MNNATKKQNDMSIRKKEYGIVCRASQLITQNKTEGLTILKKEIESSESNEATQLLLKQYAKTIWMRLIGCSNTDNILHREFIREENKLVSAYQTLKGACN